MRHKISERRMKRKPKMDSFFRKKNEKPFSKTEQKDKTWK